MVIPVADEPRSGRGVREVLVATFRRVMRLYFRDIERLGDPPGLEVRGRVFVSNHSNALIDPILVITDAACEISPIATSTLWSVPGLGWLLDRPARCRSSGGSTRPERPRPPTPTCSTASPSTSRAAATS